PLHPAQLCHSAIAYFDPTQVERREALQARQTPQTLIGYVRIPQSQPLERAHLPDVSQRFVGDRRCREIEIFERCQMIEIRKTRTADLQPRQLQTPQTLEPRQIL